MTERRPGYAATEQLKSAPTRDMLEMSRGELETLRRRLINALLEVEHALGCESSIRTREERRR